MGERVERVVFLSDDAYQKELVNRPNTKPESTTEGSFVITPLQLKAFAAVACVFSIGFIGWNLRANVAEREVAELTLAHSATLTGLDRSHREALQKLTDEARIAERVRVMEINDLDIKFTEELTDAKLETERALAAVAAGELRLRNRFTCPAVSASNGVPATGARAGVDNGEEGSGLQKSDGDFLVRLAGEADLVVTQLRACQAVVAGDRVTK
jgi:hypothetical protein